MSTGFLWEEFYDWHDIGAGAGPLRAGGWMEPGERPMENQATKRRMYSLLQACGLLDRLTRVRARAATAEELGRHHTPEYVGSVRSLSAAEGGSVGLDAFVGRGSYEVAALSAGGAIAATEAVLEGAVENVYALLRPPGHHALPDTGMGGCIFNNIVLAALHARERYGIERIAIVDWDVHHGNGAQSAFAEDPSVLTISIHQQDVFPPESGRIEENGTGAGAGSAINVPLPPGSGIGAYRSAFERVIVPALDVFAPQLLFVACGFDACGMDPMGRQLLAPAAFGELTAAMLGVAARHCDQRLVVIHEGGYHPALVPFCGLSVIEQLSGEQSGVEDPYSPLIAGMAGQELAGHQAELIDRAAELVARVPGPAA